MSLRSSCDVKGGGSEDDDDADAEASALARAAPWRKVSPKGKMQASNSAITASGTPWLAKARRKYAE